LFEIYLRPFLYPDRSDPGSTNLVEIRDGHVASIGNGFTETTPRGLLRIDPQLLAEFSDTERERRSYLPLSAIPRHVALAAVASEDRRFFRHMGLDLLGIGRATARNVAAGSVVEGGSTISQQLAKNVFLSRKRTFTRKLHEALLAVMIELRYSKEQILEFYLNQIYLGQRGTWSVCGLEDGALYYFNKHATELTLGEGALLAGIIPAPNRLSPYRDADLAIEPQNGAIRAMVGGRDYRESPFNRAVESHRQPGSAFKPFVYVAALDTPFSGRRPPLTAATLLDDVPDSFPTPFGLWAPRNYEHG